MRSKGLFTGYLVLVLLLLSAPDVFSLTCTVNHSFIPINIFYHGSTVSVRGNAAKDEDLVVKISSGTETRSFMKKGKSGGIFWMNKDRIVCEGVQGLYMLFSTKKVAAILGKEERERYAFGYDALEKEVKMTPAEDKDFWFREFLKLKEKNRLYRISEGQIKLTSLSKTENHYDLLCNWPYQSPPGSYTVTVYAIKNGQVVETAEGTVEVEDKGVVKYLLNLALNNGALYGTLSVVVALTAGFGIGLIFRKGG